MPGKKMNKQKGKKPRAESRATGGGIIIPPVTAFLHRVAGVPTTQRRTLCFTEIFGTAGTTFQSGAAGAYAELVFPLNSAYNGGNFAALYNTYLGWYNKCFVVGARAKLTGDYAAGSPMAIGMTVTAYSASLTSAVNAVSRGHTELVVASSYPDRVSLTQTVDVAQFFTKKDVLDDPNFSSTSSADPAEIAYLHLWMQSCNSTQAGCQGILELYYDCIFTDPVAA